MDDLELKDMDKYDNNIFLLNFSIRRLRSGVGIGRPGPEQDGPFEVQPDRAEKVDPWLKSNQSPSRSNILQWGTTDWLVTNVSEIHHFWFEHTCSCNLLLRFNNWFNSNFYLNIIYIRDEFSDSEDEDEEQGWILYQQFFPKKKQESSENSGEYGFCELRVAWVV